MFPARMLTLTVSFLLAVFYATPCLAHLELIRIGATVSLEGKYAESSAMIRDGYLLWEKQVNEAGGLAGHPVEIILYDDKSSPERVRELYEKLIGEDKVDLVLSPYSTPLSMAAAEVTTRRGYTMLLSGASGEELFTGKYKNVFGIYSPGKRYFIGLLDIMASNGLGSVAIVYEDTSLQRDVAAGTREWAERFGLDVIMFRSYKSGSEELPEILQEVRSVKPDGLVVAAYPEDTYRFLEEMKARQYKPKVLAFPIATAYPNFAEKAGDYAEGIFGSSQWEPDERIPFPGTKKFITDFFNFTQRVPSYHSGTAYASCQILERAIRGSRSLDNARIAEYIRSLDTVTVVGRFRVDFNGKQSGHSSIIIQWQDGKKEIVYPPNMQTSPPRIDQG